MADIFEEVDEELKEENLKKLWDRYGRFLIAAVVLLIGGVGAFKFWEAYTQDQRQAYSEAFISAISLAEEGKNSDAAAAFTVFADDASAGYAMLARFREAAARRKDGDPGAAIDIYETLAADDSIESLYRDLAVLLSVMAQADTGDVKALSDVWRRLQLRGRGGIQPANISVFLRCGRETQQRRTSASRRLPTILRRRKAHGRELPNCCRRSANSACAYPRFIKSRLLR